MGNLLCRLFGHKWGMWHTERRFWAYRVRVCQRCQASELYRANVNMYWMLDAARALTAMGRTAQRAIEQARDGFAAIGKALTGES